MRKLSRIIIHHTATPNDREVTIDEIRGWHVKDNGWRDVGYHRHIRRDGRIERGRDIDEPGAHAYGHNEDSIGISIAGTGPDFTRHQWATLEQIVMSLVRKYGIERVIGHRDVGDTKCPGFDVQLWYANN